ncbi:MAG: hypothetical protein WCO00_03035 [Rhodospirillaceae bacterium]
MTNSRYETLSQRMQRRTEESAARRRIPRWTAAGIVCLIVFIAAFLFGIEVVWR